MLFFRVCGVRQNLYVLSFYCNPDLAARIFDCLLTSMADVHAEDVLASFLFVGDMNGHHQEWLGSTTTNRHGVAAFDFGTMSGCNQLVVGSTHARGGTLGLLMTEVPDIIWVCVVAPIGNSDHSSLLAVISMAQAVPNLCVSRKVFLKHQVNWNTVCGPMQDLIWCIIWSVHNPVEVLNEHCCCWSDVLFQPRSSVCATRISLGLIINEGMPNAGKLIGYVDDSTLIAVVPSPGLRVAVRVPEP